MKTRFTTTMYEGTDSDGNTVRKPDLGGIEDTNPYTVSGDNAGGSKVLVAVTGTSTELDTARSASATTEKTDAEAASYREQIGLNPAVENSDVPDVEIDEMLNQFAPSDVLDTYEKNKVRLVQNFTTDLEPGERRTLLNRHDVRNVRELLYELDAVELQSVIDEFNVGSIPSNLDTATVARSVIQNQTVGFRQLQDQELTAMNKVAKAKGLTDSGELSKNTRSDTTGTMSDRTKRLLGGHHSDHSDMLAYLKGNASAPWTGDVNPPAVGAP